MKLSTSLLVLLTSATVTMSAPCTAASVDTIVVFRPACPISGASDGGPETALLGVVAKVLIPSLINAGLDAASAAIKAQGADRDLGWTTGTSGMFYSMGNDGSITRNPKIACLVIARGSLGTEIPKDGFEKLTPKFVTEFEKLGFSATPHFYLESIVRWDNSNGYFRLEPKNLYFGKAAVSSWGAEKRDLVVSLTFKTPGNTEKSVFGSVSIPFFGVTEESVVTFVGKSPKFSSWMALLAPDSMLSAKITEFESEKKERKEFEAAEKARRLEYNAYTAVYCAEPQKSLFKAYKSALESMCNEAAKTNKELAECPAVLFEKKLDTEFAKAKWEAGLKLRAMLEDKFDPNNHCTNRPAVSNADNKPSKKAIQGGEFGAFNLEVTLTETRRGSEFLKSLGVAFESAKPGIATGLREELVLTEREAAEKKRKQTELNAAAAEDDLLVKILEANKLVENAEETLTKLPPDATPQAIERAKLDVKIAKIKANTAYRNAIRTIPYPDVVGN